MIEFVICFLISILAFIIAILYKLKICDGRLDFECENKKCPFYLLDICGRHGISKEEADELRKILDDWAENESNAI